MSKGKRAIGITVIFILLVLAFRVYITKETIPSIVISEVCTHNESAAYDDNGDYGADYLELYNNTDEPVNLLGWGLSDKSNDLYRFTFPSIVIESHQCIIAWCSENIDDVSCYREDYIPVDIHGLGFNLSNGENVILTDDEGHIISSVAIPGNVIDNKTYSTTTQELGAKYFVTNPTPYFVEPFISYTEEEIIEPPQYSLEGGWYEDDVYVELSSKEGEIYYTLDGSEPDENSMKYTDGITLTNRSKEENIYSNIDRIGTGNIFLPDFKVDKATVLKAVAISESGKSETMAKTYFIGLDEDDYRDISVMSISCDPEDLFGYENGIYVKGAVLDKYERKMDTEAIDYSYIFEYPNYAKSGKGWERKCQIEYLSEDHKRVGQQTVGIRIHGGWSVSDNQKSFNLYSRSEYDGNDSFVLDFYEDGNNYDKLMLRTGGQGDAYLAKLRDFFCQSLVSDRAIGTQKAKPCIVFLNGEYWGLYNLQESIGTGYINRHYNVPTNNIAIVKNGELVEGGDSDLTDYYKLLDFAQNNDLSIDANYRAITRQIDIQSLIDYYALEIYVANSDAFSNNLAVWRSKEPGFGRYEDCRWRWLVYDLDESCGLDDNMCAAYTDSFVDGHWRDSNPIGGDVLFSALINNEEFVTEFKESFTDIASNNFKYENVSNKLSAVSERYKTAVINSQLRFRGDYVLDNYSGNVDYEAPYNEIDYEKDIQVMDDFFAKRASYILEYMNSDLP